MSINLIRAAQTAEAKKQPNRLVRLQALASAFEKALIQVDRECLLSYIED